MPRNPNTTLHPHQHARNASRLPVRVIHIRPWPCLRAKYSYHEDEAAARAYILRLETWPRGGALSIVSLDRREGRRWVPLEAREVAK